MTDDQMMTQLQVFLEELEQLLDKHCTPDWFYKLDIEDGVGINLSIPEFKEQPDEYEFPQGLGEYNE